MKKINVIVLFICLTLLFLTGCGTTPDVETAVVENVEPIEEKETTTAIPVQSTPEVTETALPEGEIMITSLPELQAALEDLAIKVIHINSAMDINSEISFERNDDLEIHIEKDGTMMINSDFMPVACIITNDGTMIVNKTFERGITTLVNNGIIIIQAGGKMSSGMSNTENHGTFTVESEAELSIDRGSVFNNYTNLTNNGLVSVDNGGQLNDMGGTIVNNGTIDLFAFFNGEIANITGTGTLNDHRE
jgi:hypothetical protein